MHSAMRGDRLIFQHFQKYDQRRFAGAADDSADFRSRFDPHPIRVRRRHRAVSPDSSSVRAIRPDVMKARLLIFHRGLVSDEPTEERRIRISVDLD